MSRAIYRSVSELRGFSLKSADPMPGPRGILMCPPDYFDVVDVKNPFMVGQAGKVAKDAARRQWEGVRRAFEAAGKPVSSIEPLANLEDMTFCANTCFTGLSPSGERICLLSQMLHPSRRREVAASEAFFQALGYRIAHLRDREAFFEGGGDALWHPERRLVWGGYGFRSNINPYEDIAALFDAPVILLKLVNERFYHLDTCFCPLTSEAVLIHAAAFDAASLELILKIFPMVVSIGEEEAVEAMALNGCVVDGKTVVIHHGAKAASRHIQAMGLEVSHVDTSEFHKSGGSVYCLKNFIF